MPDSVMSQFDSLHFPVRQSKTSGEWTSIDKLIRLQTPWDRRGKMLKTSIYDE